MVALLVIAAAVLIAATFAMKQRERPAPTWLIAARLGAGAVIVVVLALIERAEAHSVSRHDPVWAPVN